MKITKRQLKRIIKEERAKLLKEQPAGGEYVSHMSMPPSTRQYVLNALQAKALGGPSKGRTFIDIALDHMSDNNMFGAVDAIMDSLMIDDPAEGAEEELAKDLMRVEGIEEVASAVAAWAIRQFRSGGIKESMADRSPYLTKSTDTEAAVEQIEAILNDLYDDGASNDELVQLLSQITTDIGRGFVGEPR
jgi:hypothetical protein